jgi:hypothetical protein
MLSTLKMMLSTLYSKTSLKIEKVAIFDSDIVKLRKLQNDLCTRYDLIHMAVDRIMNLEIKFTESFAKAAMTGYHSSFSHHENYEHNDPPSFHDLVDSTVKVFDYEVLLAFVQDDVHARNIIHHLKQIQHDSVTRKIQYVELIENPSLNGWNFAEAEAVANWYKRRITNATTNIRNINTNWKYLIAEKRTLPGFVHSSCTGLFGKPSFKTDFTYTDDDFKHTFKVNGKFPVMTARWFAPFLGDDTAKMVEAAVAVIGEASKPLPGEPDTSDHFGSHHVDNKIEIKW